MTRSTARLLCSAVAMLALFALAPAAMAAPSAQGISHRAVCPPAPTGYAHCHSKVAVGPNGKPVRQQPVDWGATDVQAAYNLPGTAAGTPGSGPTIAIVDAYSDPNAASDLQAYRTEFNLGACTTASGCLTIVNQRGGSTPPDADNGWAQEISLDLDMASAACPSCKILLVQTDSNLFTDLVAGVNTAASTPGVVAISNSYGGNEFSQETTATYSAAYDQPGKAVTVSTGDNGYGVEFPAAAKNVTAVGGTSLRKSSSGVWSETAWSGAGSGCSAYVAKPSWQSNIATSCSRRAVADVSAVADPNTGVRVYDSYGSGTGWMVFGGTSASAPLVAGVYALAHNWTTTYPANYTYSRWGGNHSLLHDVTSGSNGRCRFSPVLCTAGSGWDGPTGLGTPNGAGAF